MNTTASKATRVKGEKSIWPWRITRRLQLDPQPKTYLELKAQNAAGEVSVRGSRDSCEGVHGECSAPTAAAAVPGGVRKALLMTLVISLIGVIPGQGSAQLNSGDILVIDRDVRALFRITPSGDRSILSDLRNAGQGPVGEDPVGLALEESGNMLVIDERLGTLFRITPLGHRMILTDFHDSDQGRRPIGTSPFGVAVEPSGRILVIDPDATSGAGALFRVDPVMGDRTVLSDFGNPNQGPTGGDPLGVAVEESGTILVADRGRRNLIRVHPGPGEGIGHRTLVSDFGGQAFDPVGVAIERSGDILVVDVNLSANRRSSGTNRGALFRVNPSTGASTILSDFGDSAQGQDPLGNSPVGVAVDAAGNILVVDHEAGTAGKGALFRIDPLTGHRTILTDFGIGRPELLGESPVGIAIFAGEKVNVTNPLIFIPGIAGTSLDLLFPIERRDQAGRPIGGTRNGILPHAWPREGLDDPNFGRQFSLNPNPPENFPPVGLFRVVPNDAIRQDFVVIDLEAGPATAKDVTVYSPLLDMLTDPARGAYNEYVIPFLDIGDGVHERARAVCDLQQQRFNPTLFVFPYDWRLSNAENSAGLKQYIDCIRQFYPDRRIDILAHSMGGLIARRYILDNPTNHHIDKMVTIGTPWLGAPKAAYVLQTGDFIRLNLSTLQSVLVQADNAGLRKMYKSLIEFFPGSHELLPGDAFFRDVSAYAEAGWDINGNGVGSEDYTYEEFTSLLDGLFRSTPGTTARAFHDKTGQDDWHLDSSGVQYLHIVGLKRSADTIGKVVATGKTSCRVLGHFCHTDHFLHLEVVSGDGTVPEHSAARTRPAAANGRPGFNLNAPDAKVKRFFNLPNDGSEHTNLTMDSTVHAEILSFLRDRKSVTASISSLATATPKMEQDSGTEVEPAFYVRLIGAAAVTVTDASGKSTGPPNFSSVPGVTLYITGEGSWLVILQQNQPYSVSFRSGNDAMTVEITKGTDVSTTVAVRYTDLVIPSGAAAVLKLNPQARLEVEPLRYDSDRNGTFDTEVMPTVVVEGPDADDVEAPTIEFSATVLPTVTLVDITAKDAATGVKTLFFSLDGTNFLPYAGTLTVNPAQSPIVYAFAEDNVANRSGLFTFDLCQLIHACELVNVNNFVMSFVPLDTTFTITDDRSGCPVGFIGKFSFSARLTDKITSPPLSDLRVRVKTITNGHVLQNAIGGLAGVGAQLIVPRVGDFKDGVLSPRESVDVPFVFCLNEKEPFTFLLDVLGAVADKRRHPFRRD